MEQKIPLGNQLALLPNTQLSFFHACFKEWGYFVPKVGELCSGVNTQSTIVCTNVQRNSERIAKLHGNTFTTYTVL